MITNDDIQRLITALTPIFATKADLGHFATKDDLAAFATKEDLDRFATKEDLKDFATKGDLERFATKDDLKVLATKKDLAKLQQDMTQLREDVFNNCATKQDLEDFKYEMRTEFGLFRNEMHDRFDQIYTELKTIRKIYTSFFPR